MDPLFGTLMIFSSIILVFFGLPIAGVFVMSMFSPAELVPSTPVILQENLEFLNDPIRQPSIHPSKVVVSMPISVQKTYHKGNLIWIDA